MNNNQNNKNNYDNRYNNANLYNSSNQNNQNLFYEDEDNTELHVIDQDDIYNYPAEAEMNNINNIDNSNGDQEYGNEQNNYQYQEMGDEDDRLDNPELQNDYTQQDQYNQINTKTLQEMQTNPHNNDNVENSNNDNTYNNENNEREPIYIMTLELEEGKATNIGIYPDTNPEELAYQLCNDYGLDYQAMEFLQEEIAKLMEMNMNNQQYQDQNQNQINNISDDENNQNPNNNSNSNVINNDTREMEGIIEEEEYENNENKEELNNNDLEFLNIGENQIYTFKEANERGQSHDMTESVAQEEAIEIEDGDKSEQTNIKDYACNYNDVEANSQIANSEKLEKLESIVKDETKDVKPIKHLIKNSGEVNNFVVRDHELKYYEGEFFDKIDTTLDENNYNNNTILNIEGNAMSILDSALHSKTSSNYIHPDPKVNYPASKVKKESVSSEDTKSTVLLYNFDATVKRPEESLPKNDALEHRIISDKTNLNLISNVNKSDKNNYQLYYLDFSDNNIQSSNSKYNIPADDNNAKIRGSHLNTINSEEEVQETQNSNKINENRISSSNSNSIKDIKDEYKIKNDSKVFSLKEEDIRGVLKNEDSNKDISNSQFNNPSLSNDTIVKSYCNNPAIVKENLIEKPKNVKSEIINNSNTNYNASASIKEKPKFYKVEMEFQNNLNQIQSNNDHNTYNEHNDDNNDLVKNNQDCGDLNENENMNDTRNIEIYKSPTETPTNSNQVKPNDRYKLPINRRSINVNDSINITLNENNRNNINNFPINNGNGSVANVEMLQQNYNDYEPRNELNSGFNIEASREVLINPSARDLANNNNNSNEIPNNSSKRDNKDFKAENLLESISKDNKNLHEVRELEYMPSKVDQLSKRNINKESIGSKKSQSKKSTSNSGHNNNNNSNNKKLSRTIDLNNNTMEENNSNLLGDQINLTATHNTINTNKINNYTETVKENKTIPKSNNFLSNLQQRISTYDKSHKQIVVNYNSNDNTNNTNKTISTNSNKNNLINQTNLQSSYQSNYNSKRQTNNSQKQSEDVFNKLYDDASRRRSCKASQRNRSINNDELKASNSKLNISGISKDKNISKQFSELQISQTQNKSYKQIRENSISNRSGSVRNQQYSNKGEALYYEGLKQKEAFNNKINKLKSERILSSQNNCTFQPNSQKIDGIKGYNKNNISHVMCYINKLNSKKQGNSNENNNSSMNFTNQSQVQNNLLNIYSKDIPLTYQSSDKNTNNNFNSNNNYKTPSNFSSDLRVSQHTNPENFNTNNNNKNVNNIINSALNSYNKYHYSSNMLQNSRIYDSKEYIRNKENLLQKLREKHTLPDDADDCTFKPQISAASNCIITNLNPENYLSRKIKKQEKIIEECTKELTFIPKTQQVQTSQCDKPYQKLSFEERQILYKEISENKKKDLNEMYSKNRDGKTGQELFRPKLYSSKGKNREMSRPKTGDIIRNQKMARENLYQENTSNFNNNNINTNTNLNNFTNNINSFKERQEPSKEKAQQERKNVYEANYNYAITYNNKKKELEKRIRNHEEHKSTMVSNSNQIYEKMKTTAIENLFHHLDSDQDDKITRIHINLTDISSRGLKILNPIITELKAENETLNGFEFKLAMNELFNILSHDEMRYIIDEFKGKKRENFKQNVYISNTKQRKSRSPLHIQKEKDINRVKIKQERSMKKIENENLLKVDKIKSKYIAFYKNEGNNQFKDIEGSRMLLNDFYKKYQNLSNKIS